MTTKKQFKDATGNDNIDVYFDDTLKGKRKQQYHLKRYPLSVLRFGKSVVTEQDNVQENLNSTSCFWIEIHSFTYISVRASRMDKRLQAD